MFLPGSVLTSHAQFTSIKQVVFKTQHSNQEEKLLLCSGASCVSFSHECWWVHLISSNWLWFCTLFSVVQMPSEGLIRMLNISLAKSLISEHFRMLIKQCLAAWWNCHYNAGCWSRGSDRQCWRSICLSSACLCCSWSHHKGGTGWGSRLLLTFSCHGFVACMSYLHWHSQGYFKAATKSQSAGITALPWAFAWDCWYSFIYSLPEPLKLWFAQCQHRS